MKLSSSLFKFYAYLAGRRDNDTLNDRVRHSFTTSQLWLGLYLLSIFLILFVGRNRYVSSSEFIIRTPSHAPTPMASIATLFGGGTTSSSLEDSRYLQVYLRSPDVMRRVFSSIVNSGSYKRSFPDITSGISSLSSNQEMLDFYHRQVSVLPQDLSGSTVLSTTAFDPFTAHQLNLALISEARIFVNKINQDIGSAQLKSSLMRLSMAEAAYDKASLAISTFNQSRKLLDPNLESAASTNYISALQSKLVQLRVDASTLRQQFRDRNAPELQRINEQVREMETQISVERSRLVSRSGRNLAFDQTTSTKLQNNLAFALENLKAARTLVESSQLSSTTNGKFLILLASPIESSRQDITWRVRALLVVSTLYLLLLALFRFAKQGMLRL